MTDLRHIRIQRATIGLRGMARIALRHRLGRHLQVLATCRPLLEEARGLEIGGPSAIFARDGILPLYPLLGRLDNCDFAGETIWHGDAADGSPFTYDAGREPGTRLVRDATALEGIGDASYDLVLSSHTLEHVANPLRALAEWKRVIRDGGHLVLVLPHLENTFDHLRPVTTLQHLEDDLVRSTPEDDDTHLREFIELCDLARVPERLSRQAFEQRTRDHVENRTIHHHVFDTDLVVRLLDRAGFHLVAVETALPFHIVAVAAVRGPAPDNGSFLSATAGWRQRSVFRRDRASLLI
jgi:SAM-dependent methyltransferase